MISIVLIALAVGAACLLTGLLAAGLLFLVIAALVSLGLLSASILVGAWRKSFRKGFLIFLLAGGAVAGAVCGLFLLSTCTDLFSLYIGDRDALLPGSLGGLAGGFVTGFLVYRFTGWAVAHFKRKLRIA